jgi:6-phosphogluconolactonase (cycloisomerase 2 family)
MRLAIAFLLLAPCLQAQQCLFVSENSAALESFSVSPGGVLTPNPGNPVNERGDPTQMAVNPAGTLLFVSNFSSSNISVFAIGPSCSLQELLASPFSASTATQIGPLVVDTSGNYLYVASGVSNANSSNGEIDVYAIFSTGLTLLNSYTIPIGPAAGIFASNNGKYLYILSSPGGQAAIVSGFAIGQNGTLTAMPQFTNFGEMARAFAGDSQFLFAALGQHDASIATLSISPVDGSLSLTSTYNPQNADFVGTLSVDNTGGFLISNYGVYTIANGILTLTQPNLGSTDPDFPLFASAVTPVLFATVPNGQSPFYLDSEIIGADGSLSLVSHVGISAMPFAIVATGTAAPPSGPAVTLQPSVLNFTSIPTGRTASNTITVYNTGTVPLSVTSIGITGDSSFTQTDNCPTSLGVGANCIVTVTFSPTLVGSPTASLNVVSGAPNASVTLTGTAVAPFPIISISPTSLAFPVTNIGTSAAQILTITNATNASAPLQVTGILVSGANPADFAETNNCSVVPVGGSCIASISFVPQSIGDRSATVVITSNTNNGSNAIPLSGEGIATLQISTVGPGNVTQTPTGNSFSAVTPITLTATPNTGSTFSGWSGACTGTALTCAFVLSTNATVTATFASTSTPPKISITPQSQSGTAGETFIYTVTSTGFPIAPQLMATCTIPKGTCAVSGGILTVTTTAPSTSELHTIPWTWPLGIALLALASLPRRTRKTALCVAALAICGACGASTKSVPPATVAGTPQGSYNIEVAAAGSTATGSAGLTIQ